MIEEEKDLKKGSNNKKQNNKKQNEFEEPQLPFGPKNDFFRNY